MRVLLAVAVGGALGSVGRYWASSYVTTTMGGVPVGILLVNVLGSTFIGFLYFFNLEREFLQGVAPQFLFVGLLGGFTTFSTFSLEALNLLLEGSFLKSLSYVGASVLLCLLGVAAGMVAARLLA